MVYKTNRYSILMKSGSILTVASDNYELYEKGEYRTYNFMINDNIVFIIDYDDVKIIEINGNREMYFDNEL